jgi:CDP-diacylglycerol--glycerol-3-phosphate 3-phosphatidyltransferase
VRYAKVQVRSHAEPFRLNLPMTLTLLRLALVPLFLWIIVLNSRQHGRFLGLTIGLLGLMALTDTLDGYLARRFRQTTQAGAFLDPLADKLLIACSLVLLSFPWAAPPGFAIPGPVLLAVFLKDAGAGLGAFGLVRAAGRVYIAPSHLGRLCTVLQLALILVTLIAVNLQNYSADLTIALVCGLWLAVPLAVAAAGADYAIQGVRQYRRRAEVGRE